MCLYLHLCMRPFSLTFQLCVCMFCCIWKMCWHIANMSTLSSDMLIVYYGSKCAYTSLRMCQSLCAFVYIQSLDMLECSLLCIGVCVRLTWPCLWWAEWGQDGSSGRRRLLVRERVKRTEMEQTSMTHTFPAFLTYIKKKQLDCLYSKNRIGVPRTKKSAMLNGFACNQIASCLSQPLY